MALLALQTGCQKDVSSNRPSTPLAPGDTTLLVKYSEIDSVSGQVFTGFIMKFTYDAQSRLTENYVVFSNDPVDNANHFELVRYFYNGIDTLPYKNINYSTEGTQSSTFIDTVFYFYDMGGNLISDSNLTYNGTNPLYSWKNQYSYQAGYILRTTIDTTTQTDTIYQTFQNNNLIHEKHIYYQPLNGWSLSEYNRTYDNNPNPFYIPAYYKTRVTLVNESYLISQKNNPLAMSGSLTRLGVVYPEGTVQYSYTYKPNGYPSMVSVVQDQGIDTLFIKGVFEYGVR
jgi:hypothetical protein